MNQKDNLVHYEETETLNVKIVEIVTKNFETYFFKLYY